MDLQTIIDFISRLTIGEIIGDSVAILFILTSLVEITPIKWNPLTSILSWLGNRINKDLTREVEGLSTSVKEQAKKVDALDEKIDMNEIDHIRWEILNFANGCRHEQKHSKDEFEHIINLHQKYGEILDARHLKNGLISLEYEYIEDIYRRRLEKNDFS